MKRQNKLYYSTLAIFSSAILMPTSLLASGEQKPNILFIIADDMTFDCFGAEGSHQVQTPNIDRIRSQGTLFSHTFNQGSWVGAISLASRNMLITGQNVWQVHDYVYSKQDSIVKDTAVPPLNPIRDDQTITAKDSYWPQYMSEAGYETYFTGKWHTWLEVEDLFDHVKDVRGGMALQSEDCYNREFIEGRPDKWTPYDTSYGGFWEGGRHWNEVLREDAESYIDNATKSNKPFFMYLAFNAPHDPRQSPKEFQDLYPTEDINIPDNYLTWYPYAEKIGCPKMQRDSRLAPSPRNEYSVKVNRQEYYAAITYMDKQIGAILDKLEQSGKMDNTYIIFTADQGLAVGEHGLFGKQNMYENSMRVPLIISGPNIPKNKAVDELVYMQDAMATTLDIIDSPHIKDVSYKSLLPLIDGDVNSARDAVYGGYIEFQRMIRTKDYKMLIYPKAGVVRLYDIANDPHEIYDIASDPNSKELLKALFLEFQELQEEVGDKLDVTQIFEKFINGI